MNLFPYPGSTFSGNSFLFQFISQAYFKLCAIKTFLALQTGNIKFPTFFWRLFRNKCGRCKNKPEFIAVFKFFFQSLIGIHRKTGSSKRKFTACFYFLSQVISDDFRCIIKRFHLIGSRHFLCLSLFEAQSLSFSQLHIFIIAVNYYFVYKPGNSQPSLNSPYPRWVAKT